MWLCAPRGAHAAFSALICSVQLCEDDLVGHRGMLIVLAGGMTPRSWIVASATIPRRSKTKMRHDHPFPFCPPGFLSTFQLRHSTETLPFLVGGGRVRRQRRRPAPHLYWPCLSSLSLHAQPLSSLDLALLAVSFHLKCRIYLHPLLFNSIPFYYYYYSILYAVNYY